MVDAADDIVVVDQRVFDAAVAKQASVDASRFHFTAFIAIGSEFVYV
jgi:hypothetical protein